MDPEFWHERWTRDEIAFHQHDVNAHVQAFIDRLGVGPGAHIFVPLCGKSLDLLWLSQQGFRVSGIEISPQAVRDFFAENSLQPRITQISGGQRFQAPGLDIFCADFFDFDLADLPVFDAVYDRASLIALPANRRPDYAERMKRLVRPGIRTLLLTLNYPQHEMPGPPFSVPLAEVETLYGKTFRVEELHSENCLEREPRFRKKGLTRLTEHVLLLERKP